MRFVVAGVLALCGLAPLQAQDLKAEEAAIRAAIARQNETGVPVPGIRGGVFWSGAYKAPVMDGERPVEIDVPRKPSNRVSSRSKSTVKKLEVSASGDMAWEYGAGEVAYELKDGTKGAVTNSYLRVWRKVDGGWKVAAQFSHRHDQ